MRLWMPPRANREAQRLAAAEMSRQRRAVGEMISRQSGSEPTDRKDVMPRARKYDPNQAQEEKAERLEAMAAALLARLRGHEPQGLASVFANAKLSTFETLCDIRP